MTTPCHVADQFCTAPPVWAYSHTRGECYRCGEPTCTKCSLRVDYLRYGRQRICHNCLDELDREAGGSDRNGRSMRHLRRLARG